MEAANKTSHNRTFSFFSPFFLIILRSAALPSYNLCVDYTFGFVYFVVCAVGIFVVRFVCALCFNCRMLIFMAFILM